MQGVNFPRLQKFNSGSDSNGAINRMNSPHEMSYFAPGILTPMVFEKPKCYAKTSFDVADSYA
jgi:hypothetical protein